MMDDRDLCGRFANLRREEEGQAPAFSAVLKGRHEVAPYPFPARLVAVAAALLVAAAFLLNYHSRQPARTEHGRPASSITEWKAPTDFLLETPGRDLMRTVPRIGEMPPGFVSPGEGRKPVSEQPSIDKEENS